MDTATWTQILDEVVSISYDAIALGKGTNPIILPPAIISLIKKINYYYNYY